MPRAKPRKSRFKRPSAAARTAALGFPTAAIPNEYSVHENASGDTCCASHDACFVPATVRPGDDLDLDPDYPPQSFHEFCDDDNRRSLDSTRRTLYVLRLCECDSNVPCRCDTTPVEVHSPAHPTLASISDYLKAFYHGVDVVMLPTHLALCDWHAPRKRARHDLKSARQHDLKGVRVPGSDAIVRVRVRSSPDDTCGVQLHVSDVLDAVSDIVAAREDAHTVLCVTGFDLYEEEEGEDENLFTCGRAYGGSGIAAVSYARYAPHVLAASLKGGAAASRGEEATLVRTSSWPEACAHVHPVALADARSVSATSTPSTDAFWQAEWLAAACKTAAHEVGHCFGLDHCVYYACTMQGCAHIAEDVRVPPYLCPVDLRKLLFVTGADPLERYASLEVFCARHAQSPSLVAFASWLRARMHCLR